jgi:hypothetical protein
MRGSEDDHEAFLPETVLEVRSFTPYAVRNRYPFMDAVTPINRDRALELIRRVRTLAEEIVASG